MGDCGQLFGVELALQIGADGRGHRQRDLYSTVTLLARFRG
jgi:hypothetical protein